MGGMGMKRGVKDQDVEEEVARTQRYESDITFDFTHHFAVKVRRLDGVLSHSLKLPLSSDPSRFFIDVSSLFVDSLGKGFIAFDFCFFIISTIYVFGFEEFWIRG
jgi:hypothetical protein